MTPIRLFLAACAMTATPVAAEVKSATDSGFDLVSTAQIAVPPAQLYTLLATPARWWDGSHSYSGDAASLRLDAKAGGCFCETLPGGGSVEHARVIFAQPGKMLRLQGALGPLQADAVIATLSFTLAPAGTGTKLTMRYAAAGYISGGAATLAPAVDQVLGHQLARLKAAAESTPPVTK